MATLSRARSGLNRQGIDPHLIVPITARPLLLSRTFFLAFALARRRTGAGGGPAATIQGELNATGDIKAGDISLQGHHHDEQGDNAPTSEAKP